jgi:hypothetical protein
VLGAAWKVSENEVAIVVEPRVLSSHEFQWDQKGADIDGEATGDYSGWSVSLSDDGTVVAIGALVNDENGIFSGHVRVYAWNSSSWVQRGADIDGEADVNFSGSSVSLSSDGAVVAIGAQYNDGVNGYYSGHVRVYTWNSSSWIQRGADIDGEGVYDRSGGSGVSLSNDGTVVAIGASGNDGVNGSDSGHVRIYAWVSSSWVQKGADIDGEAVDDQSGISVSLSNDGSVVAIGAYLNNNVNGYYSGHVRVYSLNSSSWIQRGADIDGEAASNYSGRSVSLSSDGTVVAIGAYGNDGVNGPDSGHVRVYIWNSTSWVQRGADIDGEAAGDQSGASVSLSNDGTVVAIGAYSNDGDNGSRSGHVTVYGWNSSSSSWVQKGADIDGEAAGDQSGISVSLSNDGSVVAIGAPLNSGNGTDSGHVRVYSFVQPSDVPSVLPSDEPSVLPSDKPSVLSSDEPSVLPSVSNRPSDKPSFEPSVSISPSDGPSSQPSVSVSPSGAPSSQPSMSMTPSIVPSSQPSVLPSDEPSVLPSDEPSVLPSEEPSVLPSDEPSVLPSDEPSVLPSDEPSVLPSDEPSVLPSDEPSVLPSDEPSVLPSDEPSVLPSDEPSVLPSDEPSVLPSDEPSVLPSDEPSVLPSEEPSVLPSDEPSVLPSDEPSLLPSDEPSVLPSDEPSVLPSDEPSVIPSDEPSVLPSEEPSVLPSDEPSVLPSDEPSVLPSDEPSVLPSDEPSVLPSASSLPSALPSISTAPSCVPSTSPSPTKTPKSTKDSRGLKAKSDGCSGKSFRSEKSSKSSEKKFKSGKGTKRRNVISFGNNEKGLNVKEGSSERGTFVEFVVLEDGMNLE